MKISLDSRALAEVVGWAARALPQRPTVPVLAGIHLAANGDQLTLSVFDYDTSARATVNADVAEPGTVVLPGRVLAEVTKALPVGDVELALSGTEVAITCGSTEFALLTLPVDDYPTLPQVPDTIGTVDAAALQQAVEQVAVAAAKDAAPPVLTCVRLDTVGDLLTLAATDRYRIHARTIPWTHTGDPEHDALIPAATLHDIAKGLPPGPIELGLSGGLAAFTGGGRTRTVRLIVEDYLDYERRLGDDYPIHADMDVVPLIAAVKRVALVAERNTPVRLAIGDGQVIVQAGGAETGRGRDCLPVNLDGPAVELAFQPAFLLEVLSAVLSAVAEDLPVVRVATDGPARPVLVTPAVDAPHFRALVQALRTA